MKERPYLGVGVLVWRRGHLLLGQRLLAGGEKCWQFPGGHLEADESVLGCAQREVSEETGLILSDCYHAGYCDRTFESGGRSYMTLYVSGRAEGEAEAAVMEPEKCACWKWFLPDSLPAPLFKPITVFLEANPDLRVLEP